MSLAQKALLVSLSVKAPTGNRKDLAATQSVQAEYQTSENAGVYSKSLYGDSLRSYKTACSRVKDWFNTITLPWGEDGIRILPASSLFEFKAKKDKLQGELEAEAAKIVDSLENIKSEAKTRLNGLYREEDFPTKQDFAEKFGLECRFYPIPEGQDFRLDISNEERDQIREDLEHQLQKTQQRANREIWERLYDRISQMRNILNREQGKLRDDFIFRTLDLCKILRDLNIFSDSEFERRISEVEKSLSGVTETTLQSECNKNTLASEVEDVMKGMAGFMGLGFIASPPKPEKPEPAPSVYIKDGKVSYIPINGIEKPVPNTNYILHVSSATGKTLCNYQK